MALVRVASASSSRPHRIERTPPRHRRLCATLVATPTAAATQQQQQLSQQHAVPPSAVRPSAVMLALRSHRPAAAAVMTRTAATRTATAQVRGSHTSRSMRQMTTAASGAFKSHSAARQPQRQTNQWQRQWQWQPRATALAATPSCGHGTMRAAALSSAAAAAPQSAPTAASGSGASSLSGMAHLDRTDPAFFDADPFRLNKKGQTEWTSTSKRPRIVVLGTGWGSVSFLKGLKSQCAGTRQHSKQQQQQRTQPSASIRESYARQFDAAGLAQPLATWPGSAAACMEAALFLVLSNLPCLTCMHAVCLSASRSPLDKSTITRSSS